MTDVLEYETILGIFGKLFDKLIIENHLTKFLLYRNSILKEFSENHHKIGTLSN
jgi:hypothetical protein